MSPRKSFVAILMALFLLAFPLSCSAEYWDTSTNTSAPDLRDSAVIINQQVDSVSYENLYHKAWQVLETRFLFRQDMSDWSQQEHKYDGKLTSLSQTEEAIDEMVKSLNDPYSYFMNPQETNAKDIDDKRVGVVSSELLPDGIGYLKIKSFGTRNTTKEVLEALNKLSTAKSLIIDLRNNRGGFIDEAVHTTSLFLQEGVFITMEAQVSATNRISTPFAITKTHYTSVDNGTPSEKHEAAINSNIPIVMLVNKSTASAAEMFAGCLQEHKRATVIGQVTTGKGICQDVEKLPLNASIRFTYAFWHLPVTGKCIHLKGLTPDVVLPLEDDAKEAAVKLLRSNHVFNTP